MVGGQILDFSIDSRRRPYNTLALPCECVINIINNIVVIVIFTVIIYVPIKPR